MAGGATKTRSAGRNLTLDLALSGVKRFDPAYMANIAPLYQWAKAVWKEPWPQAHIVMRRAYDEAMLSFGGKFRLPRQTLPPQLDRRQTPKCAKVHGPAGAVAATLERIGWCTMTLDTWDTDDGTVIEFGKTCPRTVDKLIETATEKALHKQIANAGGRLEFEQGLFLEPICKLLTKHMGNQKGPTVATPNGPLRPRHTCDPQ